MKEIQNKMPSFACTKCGACCKNIAQIAQLAAFDKGDGVCAHLNLATNECEIYAARPLVCRVDEMFESYFSSIYSKKQFYALNAKACNILQAKMGVAKRYRVKIDCESRKDKKCHYH